MKRLVVCCDGTWNRADQRSDGVATPTNVVRAATVIAKADADVSQVVYYDQGVGTGNTLDRLTGGAFGHGLEANIHEAYRFLVGNYEPEDELWLFGFSRGAYTVRSLAGMIRKCGILRRTSVDRYAEALELYRDQRHPDDEGPAAFRASHGVRGASPTPIRFVGVWDTVGALGIPLRGLRWLTRRRYQFHDAELSGSVAHGRHALAIDERRASFEPTLWHAVPKSDQTVKQVWFAGVHSDIGGGYRDRGAADLALDWMLQEAAEAGLALDPDALAAAGIRPEPLGRLHDSMNLAFRLLGTLDRPIGLTRPDDAEPVVADPTQSVHDSVRERWDADAAYRPRGLRAFFERAGDARG